MQGIILCYIQQSLSKKWDLQILRSSISNIAMDHNIIAAIYSFLAFYLCFDVLAELLHEPNLQPISILTRIAAQNKKWVFPANFSHEGGRGHSLQNFNKKC